MEFCRSQSFDQCDPVATTPGTDLSTLRSIWANPNRERGLGSETQPDSHRHLTISAGAAPTARTKKEEAGRARGFQKER